MDLRVLKYFLAVADCGSFSAAAKAVFIAQPALSRHVSALENSLGVRLFERQPRGVRLTMAGLVVYESAHRMLAESQWMQSQLHHPVGAEETLVIFGTSPTLSRVLVPGIFERCQRAASGIRLTVKENFTKGLIEDLDRSNVDIAILTNPDSAVYSRLTLRPLLEEPFVLVTQAGRRVGRTVSLSRLERIPLLMTSFHHQIVEPQLAPLRVRLNIHSLIDSLDSIRELVMKGRWSALLPVSVMAPLNGNGKFTVSEVSGVQLHRRLSVATRADQQGNVVLNLVHEMIQGEAKRQLRAGTFTLLH